MDEAVARAISTVYYDDHTVSHRWLGVVCSVYEAEFPTDWDDFRTRLTNAAAGAQFGAETVEQFLGALGSNAATALDAIWAGRADLPKLFSDALAVLHPGAKAGEPELWWDETHGLWYTRPAGGEWAIEQRQQDGQAYVLNHERSEWRPLHPVAPAGAATEAPDEPQPIDAAGISSRIASDVAHVEQVLQQIVAQRLAADPGLVKEFHGLISASGGDIAKQWLDHGLKQQVRQDEVSEAGPESRHRDRRKPGA